MQPDCQSKQTPADMPFTPLPHVIVHPEMLVSMLSSLLTVNNAPNPPSAATTQIHKYLKVHSFSNQRQHAVS
jgi:hypothetical protein